MFGVETLAVFVPAALALVLAPGPDTVYVLTRSIGGGRRVGVASAAGIGVGVLVHTSAAILGLSVVVRRSALAFRVVKYVGAAYLLYLGVETLRSSQQFELDGASTTSTDRRTSFARGVLVNVLNPKVAIFFLAFLPQFVTRTGPVTPQLAALGLTYAVLTLSYLVAVALLSGTIRRVLAARSWVEDGLRAVTGSVLVGLGVRLAVEESA
ncbi:LysE family translocator [Halomicrococcus sp. NG-SE-24]|uniref:LysE family translocator n=1 Tax=Halomicrococcus sp. NG-SE-24 TaxID=3436928 RepID=UPI003D97C27A